MDPRPDAIQLLFDRMDSWRHLPNYQLERRADLFFSLYLTEVLEAKLGCEFQRLLVPEFPLHIRTLYPDKNTDKSFKADYLAVSTDAKLAVLVELKTEKFSTRPAQDDYLEAARKKGLPALLNGLLTIFRATNAKRKYLHLLENLQAMGLLQFLPALRASVESGDFEQANQMMDEVVITTNPETRIMYILPHETGPDRISFEEFRAVVERFDNPVSRRFCTSLNEWAMVQAGERELSPNQMPVAFFSKPPNMAMDPTAQ